MQEVQKHKVKGPYEAVFKRLIDIVVSLLVIILFCWLYLILAIIVRFNLGSPIIFTQDRPGRTDPQTGKERIFKLIKFRSMTNERPHCRLSASTASPGTPERQAERSSRFFRITPPAAGRPPRSRPLRRPGI